jgi:Fur family ferric uptake transcriptional regulator
VVKAIAERNTRQKRAIRAAFETADRPLSTDEVLAEAQRDSKGLGLATVYRSIRALLDDGWLTSIEVPGKGVLYEIAGKAHHHHFSCTACHRVFELDGCASDLSIRLPRGFRASGHDVTIYGQCPACSRRSGASTARNAGR